MVAVQLQLPGTRCNPEPQIERSAAWPRVVVRPARVTSHGGSSRFTASRAGRRGLGGPRGVDKIRELGHCGQRILSPDWQQVQKSCHRLYKLSRPSRRSHTYICISVLCCRSPLYHLAPRGSPVPSSLGPPGPPRSPRSPRSPPVPPARLAKRTPCGHSGLTRAELSRQVNAWAPRPSFPLLVRPGAIMLALMESATGQLAAPSQPPPF